ncbi:hypothetical protein [Salinibaculum salinum]|uniref:hypothetical protein n=1 Tax=Salinibaculum salinum TaxID=3131996 RepID=UPI0030ED0249
METLADLVAVGRDREGAVVDAPERNAPYTYGEFSTNAWKAGNLLRHYGVRAGARMGLVIGPKHPEPDDEPGWLGTTPDPLLALLGGACLGARVVLSPPQPVEARAFVCPDAWLDRYDVAPGCSRLAYGGPPEATGVAHFERELWSENPIEPPDPVAADDPFLDIDGATETQGALLSAGESIAATHGLNSGDRIALDAPLTSAGAIAAGVVAPLAVGATIVVGEGAVAGDVRYTVTSERRDGATVDPASVF